MDSALDDVGVVGGAQVEAELDVESSRSQSSERMHVVSAPISATCVCRRLVPSNIWISLFLTSDAEEPGLGDRFARTVAAREAATRRVIRARGPRARWRSPRGTRGKRRRTFSCRAGRHAPKRDNGRRSGGSSGGWGSCARSRVDASGPGRRVCLEPPGWKLRRSTVDAVALWQPSSTLTSRLSRLPTRQVACGRTRGSIVLRIVIRGSLK